MLNTPWHAAQSLEDFPVLRRTAHLVLAALRAECSQVNQPTMLRCRSHTATIASRRPLAYRQSNIKVHICGPMLLSIECDGKGMYGPGPPIIKERNGCRPGPSSSPSSSAGCHSVRVNTSVSPLLLRNTYR